MFGYIITNDDKCVYSSLVIDVRIEINTYKPLEILKRFIHKDDIYDDMFSSCKKFRLDYNNLNYVLVSKQIHIKEYMITELRFDVTSIDRLNMLSKMNHTIKEPMNNIISIITLLQDTKLNQEQKEYFTMLNKTSIALVTVLNDVSDFLKTSSGNIKISKDKMNLIHIIENVKDIMLYTLETRKVSYEYSVQEKVMNIISDKNKIKQILVYLLKFILKNVSDCKVILDVANTTCITPVSNNLINFDITVLGNTEYLKCISDIEYCTIYKDTWATISILIANDLVSILGGKVGIKYSDIDCGGKISFNVPYTISSGNVIRKVFIISSNTTTRLNLVEVIEKFDATVFMYNDIREVVRFDSKNNFDIGIIDISDTQGSIESKDIKNIDCILNSNLKLVFLKSKSQSVENVKFYKVINNDGGMYNTLSNTLDGIFVMYTNMYRELKILIVDDIIVNQRIYMHSLNRLGQVNVKISNDGGECMKSIINSEYDIVFMDVKIPGVQTTVIMNMVNSGVIKSKCDYIIAVISSTHLKDTDVDVGIKYYKDIGFKDYLLKPISIMNIKACLDNYFNSSRIP